MESLLGRKESEKPFSQRCSQGPDLHQLWDFTSAHTDIFKHIFIGFRERRREGEREGETLGCERETSIDCLWYASRPGTKPATQACALTGDRTCDLSLCGWTRNPLNHTSQGCADGLPHSSQALGEMTKHNFLYEGAAVLPPSYLIEFKELRKTTLTFQQCRRKKILFFLFLPAHTPDVISTTGKTGGEKVTACKIILFP